MAPFRRQQPRVPREEPAPPGAFHITRLDAQQGQAEAAEPAPGDVIAVRFASPADALTLVAMAGDQERRAHPHAYRDPDGSLVVVLRPYQPVHIELARTLGGVVHQSAGAQLISLRGHRYNWADLQRLPSVPNVELAASVAPGDGAREQHEVLVVTTGLLARWILDRFHSAHLDLKLSTAELTAIYPGGGQAGPWAAVLIGARGQSRPVPRAFSQALSGLPHTVVCRGGGGRLLIDQRLTLPLPDEELSRDVPPDEQWLLAGELGVWRITQRSAEVAPPLRLRPALQPPSVPARGRFPPDVNTQVTLVPDDRAASPECLLLDDRELTMLRRFLTGQPAAERAFLVLGPGWHLFADPGGDVSGIPFGVRLHRVGPGALYTELGYRLHPAIPGRARASLFAVDAQSVVILRPDAAHRLSLADTVPIWSLWLGQLSTAKPVETNPLSDAARSILKRVDDVAARLAQPGPAADLPDAAASALRTEGFLLERQGKLAEAARKYWEAGDHALAGRLYEIAAEATE